ncbi:alternative ribosome rescue aminoacyl-tRNA hydrolase ArfB [Lacinutrix sp. MedPE-SW]|uniref:alternative ribosome rescue aminoacyl-tRNA hydrolase ArfB n=1 Tax=Lacinutrix sp. MedPE-SW TaxID=1860087 RepID=UPI000923C72F|nr:alternative ribosome rescue aminoacyl-tRNA hydrolase ArfB [Lacinutrix sp. MedPE-SW]OIQ20257.1 MAG: aminoacyl-tRNA hydrolase [Lacinutrix sp. MedPE-SW]
MFNSELLIKEFNFKAIRSSGAGGQHVNKVSTKVELSFSVSNSAVLTAGQKEKILKKLANRISKDGVFVLQCGESRSQYRNKNIAIFKTVELLKSALRTNKKRISTKVPKAVKLKRLKNKRFNSEKKSNRKKPNLN